jgi:hypothetical protein
MGDKELEELFGHESRGGAGDPLDVDGAEYQGGKQDENIDDQVSHPCTSNVWLNFKKLFKKGPKGKKVRYGVVCIHCKNSILVALQLALATNVVIGINVLLGKRKLGALLYLRSLLILMVLCIIRITVLCMLVLNFIDCFLG